MTKITALFSAMALLVSVAAIAVPDNDKKPDVKKQSNTRKVLPGRKQADVKKDRKETSMTTSLYVNGTALTTDEIQSIEKKYGVQLVPGKYWYDKNSGAWGIDGGPTVGFVMPGLNVGGPLKANASNGNTQVFINGRELHYMDVAGLQQLGPVIPGRYWVDNHWNCGYEGGPALFNIGLLIMAKTNGSKSGGPWSATTKHFTNNTTVGGDGGSFMYVSGKDSHGDSYTYFP
jgi:hypothetical protein